jgi:uncharacterized membrane protein
MCRCGRGHATGENEKKGQKGPDLSNPWKEQTQERNQSKMMNAMMNGGMGLIMLGMFLGTTLWILGLSVLIWALLTWLNRRWNKPQPRQGSLEPSALSAREILSQRYARGEIDQATFQQMREQLGATSPS